MLVAIRFPSLAKEINFSFSKVARFLAEWPGLSFWQRPDILVPPASSLPPVVGTQPPALRATRDHISGLKRVREADHSSLYSAKVKKEPS